MRETLEFRVLESHAQRTLPTSVGTVSPSGLARIVIVSPGDPLFDTIRRLTLELRAAGDAFFASWNSVRTYTADELAVAEIFMLHVSGFLNAAGEERGTRYDDRTGCNVCGAGATQLSPLAIHSRHLRKNLDFAVTIACEVVVSEKARHVLEDCGIEGFRFAPVLLPDRGNRVSDNHFQLLNEGPRASFHSTTAVGSDPFDQDSMGRCARGDLRGLNLLSEVRIVRPSWPGTALAATEEFIGVRRGLIRPRRVLLASAAARKWMLAEKLAGISFEVATLL